MNEAAALPSPAVLLSARLKQYYGRLRLPPQLATHFPLIHGYRARRSNRHSAGPPGQGGSPQLSSPPSQRSEPPTPESSSGLRSRLYTPSMAFAPIPRARHSLFPARRPVLITTRQASLNATDRWLASPKGLLTLGQNPACYRASWQLPGRDSHPQATTSFRQIANYISTSNSWVNGPAKIRPKGVIGPLRAAIRRRGAG